MEELKKITAALTGQAPRLESVEDSASSMRTDLREVKAGVNTLLRRKEA